MRHLNPKPATCPVLLIVAVAVLARIPEATAQPCDGPDAPAWVTHTRNYVLSYDQLAGYAVKRYGPPVACEGRVTTEFDGASFGVVRFQFKGGVTFEMETQPPEVSIATLSDTSGFDDAPVLRELLKTYTDAIGLEINWSDTTSAAEGDVRTETYWDPDEGMNASAQLVLRGDRLVKVGVSLAP